MSPTDEARIRAEGYEMGVAAERERCAGGWRMTADNAEACWHDHDANCQEIVRLRAKLSAALEAKAQAEQDRDQVSRWADGLVAETQRLQGIEAKLATLAEALQDAVGRVCGGRLGSIGSIHSHYLPQIEVERVERWTAALRQAQDGGR